MPLLVQQIFSQAASIDFVNRRGAVAAPDPSAAAEARGRINDAVKDKAYWFTRMYGTRITGAITLRVLFDSSGEAQDAAVLSSSLSDSSVVKSIAYSCRNWSIDDANLPAPRAQVTCTFSFDPSTVEVPPWRYAAEFKCNEPLEQSSRSRGIWNPGIKTCLYLQIPPCSSGTKPFSTFGNTEWGLYQEEIARNLCSRRAAWARPDSQLYCAIDPFFRSDTVSEQEAAPVLPSAITAALSGAGYARLVALYDHSGQNTGPGGMNMGSGPSSGGYYSAGGGYHSGGGGAGVHMTFPTRNAEQSVIVAVYDVGTGKCIFIKLRKEVDFSLAQVIEKLVENLFRDLKETN